MTTLLDVQGLRVSFGPRPAVNGVSFAIASGETVALVGESGSGKTTTGYALMRLLGDNALVQGTAVFEGRDLFTLPEAEMRSLRGRRMSIVFQEPATALNPVMRVGDQIAEVARVHGESEKAAREMAVAMLERTGIADPARRARAYPHELSGGMRQRVMIAMALLLKPALVIADEPTSALDVTVQAQILALLGELKRESNTAILFITHDLGVVAQTCSRAMVMRAGEIVESADVETLFSAPSHEYTRELLAAVPRLSP